jgi:hypothetical protein
MKWLLCAIMSLAGLTCGNAQPSVRIEPAVPGATLNLKEATASAAVRDYLESWETLRTAFAQNREDLLDRDFVGTAKDKLAATIRQQGTLGIRTTYQDQVHNLQVVFYSPEGLSLELEDKVDYDVQLFDHDKTQATQHLTAKYIVVMTPSETRWRVRIFQAEHK